MPRLRAWSATDVGRVRKHNEDFFLVDDELKLYVVCDGMGGHAAGEVASSLAAQTVREAILSDRNDINAFARGDGFVSRKDILRLLEAAVQKACSTVYQTGIEDESKRGMGTTMEVLLIAGQRGFIAHVGDSRIYLNRQGSVHQLTEDHSLVNELLKRGRLTRDQIDRVQYKNAVTRAIGVYENVEVDVFDFDVLPGDRFLVCSDGLHGYLEDGELPGLFESIAEEEIVERLIRLANERGGNDNITAVVVRVAAQEEGMDERTREIHLRLEVLHRVPLFRYVTFKELVRVMNITFIAEYDIAEVIANEGEEGDQLCVLLSGEVQAHSGKRIQRALVQGDFFGEMTLINKTPHRSSVTATQKTRLLCIRRRDFFDLVRKNHDLAVKLLWSFLEVLSQRLRMTSQELGEVRQQLQTNELVAELMENAGDVFRERRDTVRD